MFDFQFHDPTTKKPYGFPYKESSAMKLHTGGLDEYNKEGFSVDLVVKPSLFVWGDPSRPVEEWSSMWSGNLNNMEVTVDMSF
jgi:hypothetical protein